MTWGQTDTARCVDGSFIACAFHSNGKRVDAKRDTKTDAIAAIEGRKHDA